MRQARPVLPIGVVLLGKVGLERLQLLAAEARADTFVSPTAAPVFQPTFWPAVFLAAAADRFLAITCDLCWNFVTHTEKRVRCTSQTGSL